MFEKEAKEIAKDIYIHHFDDDVNYPDVLKAITVGVQKGAEHGYNKALEEIGDLRDCSNCKHWEYSTRSLSYFCDKTDRIDDIELQHYRCEHWEQ